MDKISHSSIWRKYEKDMQYKSKLELNRKVKQQENFFIGKQWEGVNAPDLEKPVLNIVKRVTNYLISVLVVDDIGIAFRNYKKGANPAGEIIIEDILPTEIERVNENVKFKSKLRQCLRNAAVDGDTALYVRFDTDKGGKKRFQTEGEIDVEIVDNTNVHFGDVMTSDVQSQPYIIISKLKLTAELKKQYPSLADEIKADGDREDNVNHEAEDDTTTVLMYLFKHNGTVWFCESTESVMLTEPTDTELTLYPVSFMNWERVKNQYHGVGVVEEVIPNQIAVNKLWAMALLYQKNFAFPKVLIDKTKVQNWDNRVGAVISTVGNPNEAYMTSFKPHDMSSQVMALVEQTVAYTKEFMGANDAVLGNINPQNTSALIQVQKASAAPLELQRLSFYQFIEDYVRICIDVIRTKYGVRLIHTEQGEIFIDYSALDYDKEINVDIGTSAYFSETAQIQTMDNLFKAGIITDAKLYVESLPDKTLPNKNEILQHLEEQQAQQEAMMMAQMGVMPNEMQM